MFWTVATLGVAWGAIPAMPWLHPPVLEDIWRAGTATWTALSTRHALLNVLALWCVGWLGHAAGVTWQHSVAWVWASVLGWLGLSPLGWAPPGPIELAGLSGALHAGVVLAGWAACTRARPPHARRLWLGWGVALWVGVAFKLLGESPWTHPLHHPDGAGLGMDVPVAVGIHVSSAAAAWLLGAGWAWWQGRARKAAALR